MSEYPRMLYHSDGRTQIVNSQEEESKLDGFTQQPSDIHRNPNTISPQGVVPRVDVSGRDEMVEMIIHRMREEFFSDAAGDDRPRRGRPPGVRNLSLERAGARSISNEE